MKNSNESGSLYLVDVLPLIPVRTLGKAYSYLADAAIAPGSLVRIPFGARRIRGLALQSHPIAHPPRSRRYKYVESVVSESFLTERQLRLAERVSATCFTGLAKTLVHFLPAIVKERKPPAPTEPSMAPAESADLRTDTYRALADSKRRIFGIEASADGILRLAAAWQAKHPKKQTLVLVPEIVAIPDAEAWFTARFGSARVAVVHSRLGKGRLYGAWERIRHGEASVIVGTRQALFAPYADLSAIFVLDEDESVGYQQWDMTPRYDARAVALELAAIHRARLVFASPSLRFETLHAIRRRAVAALPPPIHTPPGAVLVVNMRKERWKKRSGPVSEVLEAGLIECRKHRERALLIVSRSGIDSFSVCKDCRAVASCPSCGRALRTRRDGALGCPDCGWRSGTFPRCSQCGSLVFRSFGTGTEKVEREVARIVPGARIARLDEGTVRGSGYARAVKTSRDADIIVATPSALSIPSLSELSLIGIIDTGAFLSMPDFRADERLLGILRKCAATLRATPSGSLIIQTFRPEHQLIANFADNRSSAVIDRILGDREALKYPPFRRILKLIARGSDRASADRAAETVHQRLIKSADPDIDVSSPVVPLLERKYGRYERFIVVRLPEDGSIPRTFAAALRDVSSTAIVEPDPLSLI